MLPPSTNIEDFSFLVELNKGKLPTLVVEYRPSGQKVYLPDFIIEIAKTVSYEGKVLVDKIRIKIYEAAGL